MLHGVADESAEIVEREGVGEVLESENARQLVDALLQLRGDPARYAELRENCLKAAPAYDRVSTLAILE